MLGMVNPPNPDGVGVVFDDELPHPASAATAPMETAPKMSGLKVMEVLVVVRQRSLRAESPDDIPTPVKSAPVTKSGKRVHLGTVELMTFATLACSGVLV
jgi:hypothetical protein